MTRSVHLSRRLKLALDTFITSTQLVVAKKRSGKSHTAQVEAEDLLAAKQQIAVIDPTGAWWGLRSSADGRSAGFPITIFGGKHGDAPLELTAGKRLASAMVAQGFSAIFDLSKFDDVDWPTFCADFLSELYRLNTEAMHLFIDEADVCAPQTPGTKEQHRALRASNNIVRRGGIKGIGCTLISQRAALINKDLATQVDQLVVLRMNHHLDIDSIASWISKRVVDQDDRQEMIDTLPSLPVGDAYIYNPALHLFGLEHIRAKHTFDSGRTPKAGERVLQPRVLAKVDAAKLGAEIAASVEVAKANDPTALRAELARLKAELAKAASKPAPPAKERIVERQIITRAEMRRLEAIVKRLEKVIASLKVIETREDEQLTEVRVQLKVAGEIVGRVMAIAIPRGATPPDMSGVAAIAMSAQHKISTEIDRKVRGMLHPSKSRPKPAAVAPAPRDASASRSSATATDLPDGEAITLRALIQHRAGLEPPKLRVITGYKRSSSNSYLQRLKTRGFIERRGELAIATPEGIAAMPDAEPLPTGRALVEYWKRELPSGEWTILERLVQAGGELVTAEALDEHSGFKRSSRNSYLQRLKSKNLVERDGKSYRAAYVLFEEP